MPAPRMGQIGQKYQAPGGQADREPHREHDDDHRQVAGQVNLDAPACRRPLRLPAPGVVAPQLGQRQVGDELAQFRGGVGAERGGNARLVLVHREVALCQRLAELVRGLLPLAVAGANR